MLTEKLIQAEQEEAVLYLNTVEYLVRTKTILDPYFLKEYVVPVLKSLLEQKEYIKACIFGIMIEMDQPPIELIVSSIKQLKSKNTLSLRKVLEKR